MPRVARSRPSSAIRSARVRGLSSSSTWTFLDGQPVARKARIGALGYCMSGPFAVTAAARFPDRIAAAASYHGVFLATDRPDSPHLLADRIQGELYLAFGEKDHLTPPAQIETVRAALQKTNVKFEI